MLYKLVVYLFLILVINLEKPLINCDFYGTSYVAQSSQNTLHVIDFDQQ